MKRIAEVKDLELTDCPLLLFECELVDGRMERWSTHTVSFGGSEYTARVLKHSNFELKAGMSDGIDGTARVTVVLANADGRFSELESVAGFKGAKLMVRFAFFDLATGLPTTESDVVFLGVGNAPDEVTESTMRLTFANRMSLQRLQLPEVRIQRRCPWMFPGTAGQRTEAVDGGNKGKYSPFYRCGYSPDVAGGSGQMIGGQPATSCNYTRGDCEARGMFAAPAARFGGIEYLPSTIDVRSYGSKESQSSAPVENLGRYEDVVPLVYGTAWCTPVIIFARNDGNLTRMEVLLGLGKLQGVLRVLVNGVEVPAGIAGHDMTATGWFNFTARGERSGSTNPDFPDGDPYGSMSVLGIVVPNRIADGTPLPKVRVLLQGMLLERFAADGSSLGEAFANNPAWVILDTLLRAGWDRAEIDVPSFASAAAYCDDRLVTQDLNGNETTVPRYQCNAALTSRRSAGDIVRGIRNGAGLYLGFGPEGKIRLRAESTLAIQQPVRAESSNSITQINGGWPAYEFGDGTHGFGGILCSETGVPSIRMWSRTSADTVNRLHVEFQDEQNEYQQDSLSLIDADDLLLTGQEVSGTLTALGLPNFSQAARILRRQLNRSVRGNRYVEFETSVKGIGLSPGDIISLTYLREGLDRALFRVVSIKPGMNYRTVAITAQWHEDAWYEAEEELSSNGTRQPSAVVGIPKPISGTITLRERLAAGGDGTARVILSAEFRRPQASGMAVPGVPLLAISPDVDTEGGTLPGGRVYYYAVTAVDGEGRESRLSFTATAWTPATSNTNRITLTGMSFPRGAGQFHVYRGTNPAVLNRIASNVLVAASFVDAGLPDGSVGPPDENYDHANAYWRMQTLPSTDVGDASASSVTGIDLQVSENSLRGQVVRISDGLGAGQERTVVSNAGQVINVTPAWTIVPTAANKFTVVESGWRFGASTSGETLEFDVPNQSGANVEVVLRSANVLDRECAYELSQLLIWTIGGSSGGDLEPAGLPIFDLRPIGRGLLELSPISFASPDNTSSITSGTLGLHYRDELDGLPTAALTADAAPSSDVVSIAGATAAHVNGLIQIEQEIIRIDEILSTSGSFRVTRGMYETDTVLHETGKPVVFLKRKVATLGFPPGFFRSPSAANFSYTIDLPSSRLSAGTLFVNNDQGNSPTGYKVFTSLTDGGLRTYGGGQLSLQVPGILAVEANATPPLVIQNATSVVDILANVATEPDGAAIQMEVTVDGMPYCALTIPSQSNASEPVSGASLPPLPTKGIIGLNITGVPIAGGVQPGRDLTVTIRV